MEADPHTLDQVESSQMSSEEFAAYAIVLGVSRHVQPHLRSRMQPPAEQDPAVQQVRAELKRRLPIWRRGLSPTESTQFIERFIRSLAEVDLTSHGCCNRILGGRPLVMVHSDILQRRGREAVAYAAHRMEVAEALAQGRSVSEQAAQRYGLHQTPTQAPTQAPTPADKPASSSSAPSSRPAASDTLTSVMAA